MKEIAQLTPYVKIVLDDNGEKLSICTQCGYVFGKAEDNFKLGCLLFERDPIDIQPEEIAPKKDWMMYREFYCPGCGAQIEVEAAPPGVPILYNVKLKL